MWSAPWSLGGIPVSPLQMRKQQPRKNMITQRWMFPHRIQPELQFPILAVWIISWCSIKQEWTPGFNGFPCCGPTLPCGWCSRGRVVFQDSRLSSYTSSLLCRSLGVAGDCATEDSPEWGEPWWKAPDTYVTFYYRIPQGQDHVFIISDRELATLEELSVQLIFKLKQKKGRGRGGHLIKFVRDPPLKGTMTTCCWNGGRGFLAPHCVLGSPSPAPWPGPSPPSLLTPSFQPHLQETRLRGSGSASCTCLPPLTLPLPPSLLDLKWTRLTPATVAIMSSLSFFLPQACHRAQPALPSHIALLQGWLGCLDEVRSVRGPPPVGFVGLIQFLVVQLFITRWKSIILVSGLNS